MQLKIFPSESTIQGYYCGDHLLFLSTGLVYLLGFVGGTTVKYVTLAVEQVKSVSFRLGVQFVMAVFAAEGGQGALRPLRQTETTATL